MEDQSNELSKCPFHNGSMDNSAARGTKNRDWWPNQLKVNILRQHSALSDPMDKDFNYAEAFRSLDLEAVKKDLHNLLILRIGGRQTLVTMVVYLSEWHGTVPELIV